MTETARFSKVQLEDLQLGTGTRNIRLADGAVRVLTDIHLTKLLTVDTRVLRATDFNGLTTMTATGGLLANRRVWGVTAKNLIAFGATGGLTGLLIGDPTIPDRWTNAAMALTGGIETDEGDFSDLSLMIYTANTDLIVSGVGGTFDATGQIELAVHYSLLRHPV